MGGTEFLLCCAWEGAAADSPVPDTALDGLNHHLSGNTSTELMPLCGNPWPRQIPKLPSFETGHNIRDLQILLAQVLAKTQFIPGFHLLRLFQEEDNLRDFWMQPLVALCLPGSVQVEVNYLKYLHGTTPGKGGSADHANQIDTWAKAAVSFLLMQNHQGWSGIQDWN